MRANGANSDPASDRWARVEARLNDLVDWERRSRRRAARFTLEPVQDLLERLGAPSSATPFVHVAGSKGKGSVAALVARAWAGAGYRVGRYGSPHVEHLTERVEIAGRPIDLGTLAEALEEVLDRLAEAQESASPAADATWFDALTAGAWVAFERAGCERLVVECGLGGRLDSTNARDGRIAVITNIELEHCEVLGTTREAIAGEKVGIAVDGGVLVTGVPEFDLSGELDPAGERIAARVRELDGRLVRPPGFEMAAEVAQLSIGERNRRLAATVLDELGRVGEVDRDGRPIGSELLTPARIAAATLPGRLERFDGPVPVVLDGAHVPESVASVLADLRGQTGLEGPPTAILALGRDKDLDGMLKALAPAVDTVLCTSVGTELFRSPQEIAAVAESLGLAAETAVTPRAAFDRALELSAGGGWVLAIGSLYLAGELRPFCWTPRC